MLVSTLLISTSVSTAALDGQILRSDKAVLVPKKLVEEIEQVYIRRIREADDRDIRTDLQIKMEIPRQPIRMSLTLTPKGGKSLDEEVNFDIPPGGAQIDLADYLSESRGLFQLRMQMGEEVSEEDLAHLRVYFIPRHHRVPRGDEVHGVGCDNYAEISSFFKSQVLGEGLDLTTTYQAYFPMIVGSYIFVVYQPTGLKVASVTLNDSRFKNSLCVQKSKR